MVPAAGLTFDGAVVGPAMGATGPAVGAAGLTAAEADCGAGAMVAGLELSVLATSDWAGDDWAGDGDEEAGDDCDGDWVTETSPADVGAAVLFDSCFSTPAPVGAVGLLAAWSTASDGFEPPLPPWGTVVLVTGAVVLVVAGASVVVGATAVFTVVLVTAVPWAPGADGASAGDVAGAASAEAGPEPKSKKRPARSAKDATHLRGLTTSFLGLVLICWTDRLCQGWVRGERNSSAGTRVF